MLTRLVNFPKQLGQHARTFMRGAGTALDKSLGTAHHYMRNVDPSVAGTIGGALGHEAGKGYSYQGVVKSLAQLFCFRLVVVLMCRHIYLTPDVRSHSGSKPSTA